MKHVIEVQIPAGSTSLEAGVTKAARTVLSMEEAEPGSLTIVLTDGEALRTANRRYAGFDLTTDVLSFPDGEPQQDQEGVYFGDVMIAVPIAQQQADQRKHSLSNELTLLTVHGVLHLLGYDHENPEKKGEMWSRQAEILRRLDVDPAIVKE
jgi:probable rRNA maturation factor